MRRQLSLDVPSASFEELQRNVRRSTASVEVVASARAVAMVDIRDRMDTAGISHASLVERVCERCCRDCDGC